MTHSLSQTVTLACPQCGHAFPAEIWLIVDGDERPDLLARAASGDLHRLPCPQCGNAGTVDTPLLILRPGAPAPLLFSPAEHTTREQDQEHLQGLLGALQGLLGADWQDTWLETLQIVPRPILPVALSSASPEDLRQRLLEALPPSLREAIALLEESGEEIRSEEDLRRLLERRPDLRQHLESALNAPRPEDAPAEPTSGDAPPAQEPPPEEGTEESKEINPAIQRLFEEAGDLGQTLLACLQVRSPEEHRQFLEAHPELLEDAGLHLLEQFSALVQESQIQQQLRFFLSVHRRAREVGTEKAFAEMRKKNPDLPDALNNLVQEALRFEQLYLQTSNDTALDQAVNTWSTLLTHPQFQTLPQPMQTAFWNGAGGTRLRRYWRRGMPADLESAISLFNQALQATPPDSPDRPSRLNNLANALRSRYAREGRPQDLEEAITTYRQALQATPPDSPDRPSRLNNLANALSDRYAREGRPQDLEEGKLRYQEAFEAGMKTNPPQGLGAVTRSLDWAFERRTGKTLRRFSPTFTARCSAATPVWGHGNGKTPLNKPGEFMPEPAGLFCRETIFRRQ